MNVSDAFHRYAEKVCEQIRWKKAHPAVAQEIEDHLTDQKNAYLAAGDSESIAEEKALLQMGDPVSVGAALDQTHKPAPQWGDNRAGTAAVCAGRHHSGAAAENDTRRK